MEVDTLYKALKKEIFLKTGIRDFSKELLLADMPEDQFKAVQVNPTLSQPGLKSIRSQVNLISGQPGPIFIIIYLALLLLKKICE
jgi:hypothetical protein